MPASATRGAQTQTAPPPDDPNAPAIDMGQFDSLASYLNGIGLGELFTMDGGQPGGWLWNKLQQGVDSQAELQIALEQTDVFKNRFGVIGEQQKRAAAGGAGHVMTAAEVLDYEKSVGQAMAAAGMPSWLYDQPNDFHKLILADFSPQEVQLRIQQGYDYVQASPPEVRQAFDDFYGVGKGDGALAAWALDPEKTKAEITRATRTAYSGGMARRFDIEIDKASAQRIADLPRSEAGIVEGFKNVAAMGDVFDEGMSEAAVDLTDQTGLAAEFEGDAAASTAIEKRILERKANSKSSTGGAVLTRSGLTGAGSS